MLFALIKRDMGLLLEVTTKDYIIIGLSVICAWVFWLVGADKLFKFYFWAIIGFLLFLVFNSEIAVISLVKKGVDLDTWQTFLSKNQDGVLGFFTCMIPLFWLFFTLNNTVHLSVKKSFIQSIIFWVFLPPFLLWMFVYILKNSFIQLIFLRDILSLLDTSAIKTFFEWSPHIVFFFLLFVLFYKMVFGFFYFLLTLLFVFIAETIRNYRLKGTTHSDDTHHDEHLDERHDSGHH